MNKKTINNSDRFIPGSLLSTMGMYKKEKIEEREVTK